MSDIGDRAERAVVRLHGAIEGWYRGTLPEDAFDDEIAGPLTESFRMVAPSVGLCRVWVS